MAPEPRFADSWLTSPVMFNSLDFDVSTSKATLQKQCLREVGFKWEIVSPRNTLLHNKFKLKFKFWRCSEVMAESRWRVQVGTT